MAQQPDIVGMFTGISSKPISPTAQAGSDLRRSVLGMLGKEPREVTQQRQISNMIANFDTVAPAQQKQIIAQLQTVGQGALAQQLASRVQAAAQSRQEQDRRAAFSTYLSQKYPNSGLDVLATEGVVTPANFKDFLAEKQGASLRQGKRYTIRDEEGNMFAASTSYSNVTGAFDTIYTPLGTTTSDSPIGDIEIITEAGVSFAEKEEAKINTADQINNDKLFGQARMDALGAKFDIEDNLIGLQEGLALLDTVKTGGPITNMTASVQKFLGTTPADRAELEFRLANRVLSNLKSTFGGVISEGEREYLIDISANIRKGNAGNRAILNSLLEIQKRAKIRNDLILSSRNYDEYNNTILGYDFKDPVVGEDEDENVIDFGDL